MKEFKFEGRYITLEVSSYQNNDTLAILAYYDDYKEDFDVLTTNLCNPLQSGEKAFIDTNNIEWAERFIQEFKLGEYQYISQPSGFWSYPLYKFDLKKLK